MSIELITVANYKTRYPDSALSGINNARIQSAINLAFSYLDVKTGCSISQRWPIEEPTAGYLTAEQKQYCIEAMYVETQYIISNNMDFSQGADQTSFGSLSVSSSRPNRKEVCETALMYLQKAGLYDYLSFSNMSYAGGNQSIGTIGEDEIDPTNKPLPENVSDARYVHKNNNVPNKWLKTNAEGQVIFTEYALDPTLYYNRTEISEIVAPLQETCTKLGLGYLKSISRNAVNKTITIKDDIGNAITFPYGGSGGGGGGSGGISDVLVNGVSVVTAGIAEINLVDYATKLELLALLDDAHTSSTKTWSSQKIQSMFNTLSGVATISVVEVLPSTLTNNTMYYVKISESNYAIKMYANNTLYDMGTTQMDFTHVVSTNTEQEISGLKKFQDGTLSTTRVQSGADYKTIYKSNKITLESKVGTAVTSYDVTLPSEAGTLLLMEQIVDSMHHTGLKVIDAEENNRQAYIKPYAFIIDHPTDGLTSYEHGKIYCHTGGSGYTYTLPSHTGTLMTTGDLAPALQNYYTKTQAEAKFLVKITDALEGQSCDDLLNEVQNAGESVLFTDVRFTTAESPNEESETRWECEVHRSNSSESNEAHIIAKNYAGVYINRYVNGSWSGWEKYATQNWINFYYYNKNWIQSNYYIKSECDSTFLKLSGGNMTGTINMGGNAINNAPVIASANNSDMTMRAGYTNWQVPRLDLKVSNGTFELQAGNTSTATQLVGKASDKSLTWDSKDVMTSNYGLSTPSPVTTYIANNSSRYTKIGKFVILSVNVKTTAIAIPSETVISTGLPVPADGFSTFFTCYIDDETIGCYITGSGQLKCNTGNSRTTQRWIRGTIVYLASN